MMDSLFAFFGRFHPLLVHLPIGFIMIILLIEFNRKRFKDSESILKFILFWTNLSTLFSIASGYFQYRQEGYLWETVQVHFFLGWVTLLFSMGFYFFLQKKILLIRFPRSFFSIGLLLSTLLTGHLGGGITHGEDHFSEPLEEMASVVFGIEKKDTFFDLDKNNYSNKPLYSSLIAPILSQKCSSCHNEKRNKGGLQLHTYELLLKGGKNGPVIDYGSPHLSELLSRIQLPKEAKKHMPPKSKKQLTKHEIALIKYWIEQGAPEQKNMEELGVGVELIEPFFTKAKESVFPDIKLDPPNFEIIEQLHSKNILVSPVNRSSNLFTLSTLNQPEFSIREMKNLEGLKEHLVSIDLSYSAVNDSVFKLLATFPNLIQIKLNHTRITGEGIQLLQNLKYLKTLYLVQTDLNPTKLELLLNFPSLEKAFVFHSERKLRAQISISPELEKIIEFGDLFLQKLPSDEVVY